VTPNGAPKSARCDTRLGASIAKATDKNAPIELATRSTVASLLREGEFESAFQRLAEAAFFE